MNKIPLEIKSDDGYRPESWYGKSILSALPFFKSTQGEYFHRLRSGTNHWDTGKLRHTSVHFWCGSSGFLGAKGKLYARIPDGSVICATCEGRAIGSGQIDSGLINERPVKFSPRLRHSSERY